MPTPQQKNLCPGDMKFTVKVDFSIVIINLYIDCLI